MNDIILFILIILPFAIFLVVDFLFRLRTIKKHKECLKQVAGALQLNYHKEVLFYKPLKDKRRKRLSWSFLKTLYHHMPTGTEQPVTKVNGKHKGRDIVIDSFFARFRQINTIFTRITLSINTDVKAIIEKKAFVVGKYHVLKTGYNDFDRKIRVRTHDEKIVNILHDSFLRENILHLKNPFIEVMPKQIVYRENGLVTDKDYLMHLVELLSVLADRLEGKT